MKKALTSIAVMTCVLCLAGCGFGSEPEHKITDPLPDKVIETVEEKDETTKEEATKTEEATEEKLDSQKTEEELQAEYEEWKASVLEDRDKALEEQESTTTETTTTNTTTETTKTVDPYSGLAVAKCHSVTLPKGVDYNTAMTKITEGTSAYPNTFPVIDNVDFNTPGVYTCAWVRKMDDGTFVPLNYAVFTVTITDAYNTPLINAERFEWSISNHSKEVLDTAREYMNYYGTGEVSCALTQNIIGPGVYTITWTSTDGGVFNQSVTVVE